MQDSEGAYSVSIFETLNRIWPGLLSGILVTKAMHVSTSLHMDTLVSSLAGKTLS